MPQLILHHYKLNFTVNIKMLSQNKLDISCDNSLIKQSLKIGFMSLCFVYFIVQ
jgi:hypothetical protein